MKRSKKVVFAVHCLLNQNARAKGVAKTKGVVKEFVDFCIENEYGIVPIECPQLCFEPLLRNPENKETYDNEKSKTVFRRIAKAVVKKIKMYQSNDYLVEGICGVEGSPSCGAVKTHITMDGETRKVKESGVFFDVLKEELNKENITVKLFDWDIQTKKVLEK